MGKKKNKKDKITFLDVYKGLRKFWKINPKTKVKPNKKRKSRTKIKQNLRKKLKK